MSIVLLQPIHVYDVNDPVNACWRGASLLAGKCFGKAGSLSGHAKDIGVLTRKQYDTYGFEYLQTNVDDFQV